MPDSEHGPGAAPRGRTGAAPAALSARTPAQHLVSDAGPATDGRRGPAHHARAAPPVPVRDVLDYSERTRAERRKALDQMAADAGYDSL